MTDDNEGWIEHDGKGMPVDGNTWVNVKYRFLGIDELDSAGVKEPVRANALHSLEPEASLWVHSSDAPQDDITHYKVVK